MSKSTKEEKAEPAKVEQPTEQPQDPIAQPDKNNPDSQAYIKENAKHGESVYDPLTSKQMREGINVELGDEEK